MTNYETAFPDDFPAALRDFAARVHEGRYYGSRPTAARELRVNDDTMAGWLKGRPCAQEQAFRRLMTLIVATDVP